MFRKISNLRLILLLVVIVAIYVSIRAFRKTGRSKSFRTEIVQIDTSNVTKISVDKKGMHFEAFKDDAGAWKVTLPEFNKTVEATSSSVKSAMSSLISVKPSRIATKDPAKWAEYQVDTSGTRIRIYEGSKNTLDLIIGRFGMQGRQQFFTYVRLFDENTVYTADNFMGVSFFDNPESFRNSRFLQLTPDSVRQITFNYPGDTSFILNNPDSVWYMGSVKADSAAVAKYLSDLRYVSSTKFVDDISTAAFILPVYTATINLSGLKTIKVQAYANPKYGLVLHSESNPNNYFSDESMVSRVFKSGKGFIEKK